MPKGPTKLSVGGDQHSVLVCLVEAGAYGDKWTAPNLKYAYLKNALTRLTEKKWVAQIGGQAQITEVGLQALEQAR
jgi:hypothetical protein